MYRNNLVDFLEHSKRLHHVSMAFEVDVTQALQRIADIQRQTRVAVSFNAYIIYVFARVIFQNPEMQAVRVPYRRKVAYFDGVDVGTAIEQSIGGGRSIALPYTIRDAHAKTLYQICREMRAVRKTNMLLSHPEIVWRGRLAHYPKWIRRLVWKWVDGSPVRRRRIRGTVGLTNLSFLSDGKNPGFGIPMSILPSGLGVGAIYDKMEPSAESPRGFEVRKKLCVTLQANHDLIDGAPMVRTVRALIRTMEAADGLDDAFIEEIRAEAIQTKKDVS